jgi:hypothetical protein
MKVQKHAPAPRPGQLTERIAKKTAYVAGLSDLTLNRNGMWVAFDYKTAEQPYITPKMAQEYGVL